MWIDGQGAAVGQRKCLKTLYFPRGHVNQHCVGASPQSGQASGSFSHKTPKIFNIISRINNLRNI